MLRRLLRLSLLFLIGVGLTFMLLQWNVPMWLTTIIVLFVTITIFIGWPFYVIYRTRSIRLVDRYLKSYQNKPIFGYAYMLAHGTDEQLLHAIDAVIQRYPQKEMQVVSKGNRYMFTRDANGLMKYAQSIEPSEYRVYYLAVAHAMRGELEEASRYRKKLQTPWTIFLAEASIAHAKGDTVTTEAAIASAVATTRGLQRYSIYYGSKRMIQDGTKKQSV